MNARFGSKLIHIPSEDALMTQLKMSTQTPDEIVDDYLNLPKLPYGQTIKIDKIGCLNYNPLTKQQMGNLAYKNFRLKCPEEFPKCENPDVDYTDDEQVSPVIIISGNIKYRVKMLLWFPLCDAFTTILSRQSTLNKKLLPIDVLIDESDQFMVKLMNLGLSPPTISKSSRHKVATIGNGERRMENVRVGLHPTVDIKG